MNHSDAMIRRSSSDTMGCRRVSESLKRRVICLTVDHEIFGNGTGDVRRHVIDPTERMARACERFGVPLTVFFEVEEYLAFEREREALQLGLGYDPAAELRAQAVDLVRRGHDLQVHLHPEWVGSRFDGGRWVLRLDHPTVDSLCETQEGVSAYLGERKSVIDGFYETAGSPQRVTAYRCGAFCAQPGRKLLRAMAEHGLVIDSSVVKGLVRNDEHVHLNFAGISTNRRHWRVSADVAVEDTAGLVTEIPIYSEMGRRVQQLTPRRLMAKFSSNVPMEKQREMVRQLGMGRSATSVLRFLAQRFPIKLDFHNMSSEKMLRWIRHAPPAPEGDLDVIVLIGHSKEHRDDKDFERFLGGVTADPGLEVVSMSQIAERLKEREFRSDGQRPRV